MITQCFYSPYKSQKGIPIVAQLLGQNVFTRGSKINVNFFCSLKRIVFELESINKPIWRFKCCWYKGPLEMYDVIFAKIDRMIPILRETFS
jgi:hypothetical protein